MRQKLGQHFLQDTRIAKKIVNELFEIVEAKNCERVLEIGPGKGALTFPILNKISNSSVKSFTLVEKDYGFSDFWFQESKKYPQMKLVSGDFLEIPEDTWNSGPVCIISNLPYSAGTAILNRLAAHPKFIRGMVLMFQQEVAERLRARPQTKEWGSLSIWIQNQWEVTSIQTVPKGAFSPPPKVTSEVLKLVPREEALVSITDGALWEKLLKACFAHRRKMLRSGLSGHPMFKEALKGAGIDPTKRAEALGWDEWKSFYQSVLSCAK
jgi:16S rRNA (adenine1518-N6/adenine1519-N6)-dimethyltransferase